MRYELEMSLSPMSVSMSEQPWSSHTNNHTDERDFPAYISNPASRKRNAWSYIDARDLGQICDLAIKKNGLGFQVFNATNDTITVREKTKEFLAKNYPQTKVTREMGEYEAPLSNRKIREVLGFKDVHDWKKYVKN
jgi:nucleoside-diphosphate-sugar epimerase